MIKLIEESEASNTAGEGKEQNPARFLRGLGYATFISCWAGWAGWAELPAASGGDGGSWPGGHWNRDGTSLDPGLGTDCIGLWQGNHSSGWKTTLGRTAAMQLLAPPVELERPA